MILLFLKMIKVRSLLNEDAMKWINLSSTVILGTFLLIVMGCGSSGSSTRHTEVHNTVESGHELSLEDYLRRLNGVQVTGSGAYLRVSIRSNMSLKNPNEQPLFVLNGQEIGRNYSQVHWLVNSGSILSVEAIPPSRATEYGMQGGAGVIVIETE